MSCVPMSRALTHLNTMQRRNFIRLVFFVVFFSIGAASLGISILCDDLVEYFQNKNRLVVAQQARDRLESLNDDYDALLKQLEDDPNLVKRLAPATLGSEPEDINAVYPRATTEQLAAASKALTDETNKDFEEPVIPRWLNRCSEPRRRIMLFLAGAALILTSFACFGPVKQPVQKE